MGQHLNRRTKSHNWIIGIPMKTTCAPLQSIVCFTPMGQRLNRRLNLTTESSASLWKQLVPLSCRSFTLLLWAAFKQGTKSRNWIIGIPMRTICAPLLADCLLYSYGEASKQKLMRNKWITEAKAFNFTFRCFGDVLQITFVIIQNFANWIPLIYPNKLWGERNNRNRFLCFFSCYLHQILHQCSSFNQTLW